MATNNNAAAAAATAKISSDIDRNHTGASPNGEMATHRSPNKTNKASAIDALRATETSED